MGERRWTKTQLRIIEQAQRGATLQGFGRLFRIIDRHGNGGTDHLAKTVQPLIDAGEIEAPDG